MGSYSGYSDIRRVEYCKRRRRPTKHASLTDLDTSTTPLMDDCQNDDVIQLGPLRSQWLSHIADMSL